MTEKCKFIDSENPCKFNCNYGDYCYKHRRNFLIVDDDISRDRFTGLSKDYLKKDLINYMLILLTLQLLLHKNLHLH